MNHVLGKLYASEKAAYKWMPRIAVTNAVSNREKRFIKFISYDFLIIDIGWNKTCHYSIL
jgi:hypothetical protein